MGIQSNLPFHLFQIEDFLSFTESRPDEEKWELIDGRPYLSPSPNYRHQKVVGNLIFAIGLHQRSLRPDWAVIPGIGVEISPINAPVPDVLVRPNDLLAGSICDDMIVAFEILSPSTADHDLRWKRRAYATLPTLQHYVVIAQDDVDVIAFDRATGFSERRLESIDAALDLPALGLSLPLRDIYENTGVSGF